MENELTKLVAIRTPYVMNGRGLKKTILDHMGCYRYFFLFYGPYGKNQIMLATTKFKNRISYSLALANQILLTLVGHQDMKFEFRTLQIEPWCPTTMNKIGTLYFAVLLMLILFKYESERDKTVRKSIFECRRTCSAVSLMLWY